MTLDGHTKAAAAPASANGLLDEDKWLANFDVNLFREDIQAIGKKLAENQGQEDVNHLFKIEVISNVLCAIGLFSMWLPVNIATASALSLWTFSRWTMIGHHTCHGCSGPILKTRVFSFANWLLK
jgi:hypothetical protein